uniref:Putative phage metallopeptidase domain-containing protein n=1 Tax=viral metagenome TaxID=1070528 RepID=A0A6M3LXX9_9ZZZZ
MRYEDCGSDVVKLMGEIQDKYFQDLRSAKIKCIFDTKLRKSKGRVMLATIRKTNELLRHLTIEEAKTEEGFDYIVTINKKAWELTSDVDKERLLRHELRHSFISHEDVKDPYRIIDHDIQDFVEEVKLNVDDPGWANRVSALVLDAYEQEREAAKEAKKAKKKRKL